MALIVAVVIGILVAIAAFIALGLTVGWLWGFVVAIVAGPLLAFGLFAWMIHPPTPPAAPAPAHPAPAPAAAAPPVGGAAPAAPANSSHAFIGVLLGCFATVITSIITVEVAAMMTDRGGIRVVAFLAPYAIGGVIGTVAYFRHGTS